MIVTIRIWFVELHSLCREQGMKDLTDFVLASMPVKVWKQAT